MLEIRRGFRSLGASRRISGGASSWVGKMRAFTKIISATAVALSLAAIAAPAQAAVFAQFSPDTGRSMYSWGQ